MPFSIQRGVLAVGLATLVACEAPGTPRLVPVSLRLMSPSTAPLAAPPAGEPLTVTAAHITVSRGYLVPGEAEDENGGGGVTLFDEVQDYDLFDLQNGVSALLGDADVPEGQYSQLRLVITSAEVTLSDNSTRDLTVPSGMQSGVKVSFPGTISIGGDAAAIELEMDVEANFHLAPPSGAGKVIFTPVVVGTVQEG